MKKMLMLVNGLQPGGAENFAFSLAARLQTDYSWQVDFAYVRKVDSAIAKEMEAGLKSRSHDLYWLGKMPDSGFSGFYGAYQALRKIVNSNRYCVICSLCELPDLLNGLLKVPAAKKFRVLQNVFEWSQYPKLGKLLERLILSRRFSFQTAVSHSVLQNWIRNYGIKAEDVCYIPNGVDAAFFQNEKESIVAPAQQCRMALVGRMEKQKDHRTAIAAMEELKASPAYHLDIIGDGSLKPALKDEVKQKNLDERISFHDAMPRKQLIDTLRTVDLLIMPSRYEGLPLTAIEAMAIGIPVVASNAPGIVDCINSSNGVLFEPGNAKELAAAVKMLLADPDRYRRLANAAKQSAKEYSYQTIAAQYDQLLSEKYECM